MGFHGGMSVIQIKTRKCPATHSWMGFHEGMSVIQIETGKCPATHTWMGFHEGMSVIQIETGKCPATHTLDGISWRHLSDSNRDWEVPSNSQAGWDFMKACQ
jgi:hypothetical protein